MKKTDRLQQIKDIIDNLRDRAYFGLIEDCPEDCNEDKTSWDELEDHYTGLYFAMIEIERLIKAEKDEKNHR